MSRTKTVSVIGGGGVISETAREVAGAIGAELVGRGYRLVTGGLGGVMEAAARGAYEAGAGPGSIVAIIPGHEPDDAHPWADVVLATGLGLVRNSLVAHSDAVIAVGGGAGTLSEMALAWKLDRLVIAIDHPEIGGWSGRLAGKPLDDRRRHVRLDADLCHRATTASDAVDLVDALLDGHLGRRRADGLDSIGDDP